MKFIRFDKLISLNKNTNYKCVLVYLGFNDGMKLYFVEKVGRGSVYVSGIIYEEIYKSIKLWKN